MAKLTVDIPSDTSEDEIVEGTAVHNLSSTTDDDAPIGLVNLTVYGDRDDIISWLENWYMPGCDISWETDQIEVDTDSEA